MISYKGDILALLREAGYNPARIRNEKLLGQSYLTQLRAGELVSWAALDTICKLTGKQPGDLIEYREEG